MSVDDNDAPVEHAVHARRDPEYQSYATSPEDEEEEEDRRISTISSQVHSPAPLNIHMENTCDVNVGPRLLYNAPVTVNQHVHVTSASGNVLEYALKAPIRDLPQAQANIQGTYTEKVWPVSSPLLRYKWWLLGGLAGLMILTVVLVVIFVIQKPSSTNDSFEIFAPSNPPESSNLKLPNGRHVYLKSDWYGLDPKYSRQQRLPTYFVVISNTVTPPCYTYTNCALQMRSMQADHMAKKFPDIGYNWVVGGDGNVYEGRGWNVTNFHTGYVRHCNTAISLIGNFLTDVPTNEQIASTLEFIQMGVSQGYIAPDYKLVPMSLAGGEATVSPGPKVVELMQTWPHYFEPNQEDIGICPYDI